MEVSTMFYICTYCLFTLWDRSSRRLLWLPDTWLRKHQYNQIYQTVNLLFTKKSPNPFSWWMSKVKTNNLGYLKILPLDTFNFLNPLQFLPVHGRIHCYKWTSEIANSENPKIISSRNECCRIGALFRLSCITVRINREESL